MLYNFLLLLLFHLSSSYIVYSTNITVIHLLVLVPWPDPRDYSGRDGGLGLLPGARVAAREVNQRTDLLPGIEINLIEAGHEACGLTEHSLGLLNLVNYGINPLDTMWNVAAVLGLYCSTVTAPLSTLASREGIELLQLSAANSPVFNKETNRFPHLWRFLQSAGVYADVMINMMDEYDWNRIAIVSSEGNTYHSGIADILAQKISSSNKTIVYRGELFMLQADIENQVLTGLKKEKARIVFVTAETAKIVSLLCSAHNRGMLYPNYLWIIPDETVNNLSSKSTCGKNLQTSLEGSVLLDFSLSPQNSSHPFQSSGSSYNEYLVNYYQELENVRRNYTELVYKTNTNINRAPAYGALLYDQVWAFSLALNNALPQLISRNLSVQDYGFGHPNSTKIIEEHLMNLSFRGASGHISFNDFREVMTLIDVYQIINGTSVIAGERVNSTNFSGELNLNFSRELDDEVHRVRQVLPVGVTIMMAFCIVPLSIFISSVLSVMLMYRHEPEIKAVSPTLSLLIFLGCYTLIVVMILLTIEGSVYLSETANKVVCRTGIILEFNSQILIAVTIFLTLNRVYKIFYNSNMQKTLGVRYENWAMALQSGAITAVPNLVYLVLTLTIRGTNQQLKTVEVELNINSVTVISQYRHCYGTIGVQSNTFRYFFVTFLFSIGFLNVYLASKLVKVPSKNFSNTRFVNILMVLLFTSTCISGFLILLFVQKDSTGLYTSVVTYIHSLLTVLYCLFLLFIPSIFVVLKRKLVN